MIDDLITRVVAEEINKMSIKDKMVGQLVKKFKRGTFQAVQECSEVETAIQESTLNYIREWLKTELLDSGSPLRKRVTESVKGQVYLELARQGFGKIF